MRSTSILLSFLCVLAASSLTLHADDYLTKDGKLTHTLKITQLQAGFVGLTGNEYLIQPDGSWTRSSLFKQKATPKGNGKLTTKALEKVAALLSKNDLEKLPPKTGKQPGANPFTLTIEYGKHKVNFVGKFEPKLNKTNPAASDESRIASVYHGVVGILKGGEVKKAPSK